MGCGLFERAFPIVRHYSRMTPPRPLPDPFASAPFASTEARAAGISESRLRASDLSAPMRGVRVPQPVEDSLGARMLSYRVHMAHGEYFSHVTAARLYEIPLPRMQESTPELHVSVHAPDFPPRVRGVIAHRLFVPIAPRIRKGFAVVSPARTWTQLAAILTSRGPRRGGRPSRTAKTPALQPGRTVGCRRVDGASAWSAGGAPSHHRHPSLHRFADGDPVADAAGRGRIA